MPIASAPRPHARPAGLLRARAHFIPWILLAVVIGFSVAGARREAAATHVDVLGSHPAAPVTAAVAVHCDLRHGFVLRLAMYAQLMVHSVVPGNAHAQHTHGGTCRVQP